MTRPAIGKRTASSGTDTVTHMTQPRRPRGSLRDPLRVGVTIERTTDDRFAAIARSTGISKSALFEWAINRLELDENGVPVAWDPEEELPLRRTG